MQWRREEDSARGGDLKRRGSRAEQRRAIAELEKSGESVNEMPSAQLCHAGRARRGLLVGNLKGGFCVRQPSVMDV